MKRIAVRVLGLKIRLFEKMSGIKSVRYPALSVWLGVYGGELPSSLAPVPIRRSQARISELDAGKAIELVAQRRSDAVTVDAARRSKLGSQ